MAGAAKNAAATAAVTAKCLVPLECPSFVKAGASCLSTCYVLYRRGPCGRNPLRLRIGNFGLCREEAESNSRVNFGVRTQTKKKRNSGPDPNPSSGLLLLVGLFLEERGARLECVVELRL